VPTAQRQSFLGVLTEAHGPGMLLDFGVLHPDKYIYRVYRLAEHAGAWDTIELAARLRAQLCSVAGRPRCAHPITSVQRLTDLSQDKCFA
jgi:hypothetical protein